MKDFFEYSRKISVIWIKWIFKLIVYLANMCPKTTKELWYILLLQFVSFKIVSQIRPPE
jgi:hypothetical protein